jgi:hypothetical protein
MFCALYLFVWYPHELRWVPNVPICLHIQSCVTYLLDTQRILRIKADHFIEKYPGMIEIENKREKILWDFPQNCLHPSGRFPVMRLIQ